MEMVRIRPVVTTIVDQCGNGWTGMSVEERLESRALEFRLSAYQELLSYSNIAVLDRIMKDQFGTILGETSVKGQEAALMSINSWFRSGVRVGPTSAADFVQEILSRYCGTANGRVRDLIDEFIVVVRTRFSTRYLLSRLSALREWLVDLLLGRIMACPAAYINCLTVGGRSKLLTSVFQTLAHLSKVDNELEMCVSPIVADAVRVLNSPSPDKNLKDACYEFLILFSYKTEFIAQLGLTSPRARELRSRFVAASRPQTPQPPSVPPMPSDSSSSSSASSNTLDEISVNGRGNLWAVILPENVITGPWLVRKENLRRLCEYVNSQPVIPPSSVPNDHVNALLQIFKSDPNIPVLFECCRLAHSLAEKLGMKLPQPQLFLVFSFTRVGEKYAPLKIVSNALIHTLVTKTRAKMDANFFASSEIACMHSKLALIQTVTAFIDHVPWTDRMAAVRKIAVPFLDDADAFLRESALALVKCVLEKSPRCVIDAVHTELNHVAHKMSTARRKIINSVLVELPTVSRVVLDAPKEAIFAAPSVVDNSRADTADSHSIVLQPVPVLVKLHTDRTRNQANEKWILSDFVINKLKHNLGAAMGPSSGILFPPRLIAVEAWVEWLASEQGNAQYLLIFDLLLQWILYAITELNESPQVWKLGTTFLKKMLSMYHEDKRIMLSQKDLNVIEPFLLQRLGTSKQSWVMDLLAEFFIPVNPSSTADNFLAHVCEVLRSTNNKKTSHECLHLLGKTANNMSSQPHVSKMVAKTIMFVLEDKALYESVRGLVQQLTHTDTVQRLHRLIEADSNLVPAKKKDLMGILSSGKHQSSQPSEGVSSELNELLAAITTSPFNIVVAESRDRLIKYFAGNFHPNEINFTISSLTELIPVFSAQTNKNPQQGLFFSLLTKLSQRDPSLWTLAGRDTLRKWLETLNKVLETDFANHTIVNSLNTLANAALQHAPIITSYEVVLSMEKARGTRGDRQLQWMEFLNTQVLPDYLNSDSIQLSRKERLSQVLSTLRPVIEKPRETEKQNWDPRLEACFTDKGLLACITCTEISRFVRDNVKAESDIQCWRCIAQTSPVRNRKT